MKTLFSGIQPSGELAAAATRASRAARVRTIAGIGFDRKNVPAGGVIAPRADYRRREEELRARPDRMSEILVRGARTARATDSRTMAEVHGKLEPWR